MRGFFSLSERGNAVNEDFAHAANRYGIVIDGASGLAGAPLFPNRYPTNAQWLSHAVGERACAALDAGASARDVLEGAVAAARSELEAATGRPVDDMDPLAVPPRRSPWPWRGRRTSSCWASATRPPGPHARREPARLDRRGARVPGRACRGSHGRARRGPRPLGPGAPPPRRRRHLRQPAAAQRPGRLLVPRPDGRGPLPPAPRHPAARGGRGGGGMSDGMWRAFDLFRVADPRPSSRP